MPKLKTIKGVKDRVKVTGTGKILVFRSGRRHLLGGKSAKRKRQLRRARLVSETEVGKIRPLVPYL